MLETEIQYVEGIGVPLCSQEGLMDKATDQRPKRRESKPGDSQKGGL